MHLGSDERDVGANRADVRDVVVEALQFEAECAQPAGARRRFDSGSALEGMAEGRRVREARITGNTLGEANAVRDGQSFEEFLNALVHVKHAELQVEHRFARRAEQEVAGLDDARVDRAHRYLEDTFAFDLAEFVPRPIEGRELRAQFKILAQRVNFRPIVVQNAAARVGMAEQFDAEQILDFTLLPVDRVNRVGEGSQLRVVRRNGHAHQDETVLRVERVEVVNEKDVVPGAGILGKHAGQPAVVFPVEGRAERAGQLEPGVQVKLIGPRRVCVFDLRAEALFQLVEDAAQGGKHIHADAASGNGEKPGSPSP